MSGAGKEVPGGDTGAAEEVVEDIGIPEAKLVCHISQNDNACLRRSNVLSVGGGVTE